VRVVSADWVVPVDGPPIMDGAVAFDDGRIVAVGPAAELGAGTHHPDAVVIPGFVNAHSHLEYAVYAGFGDGLAFFPWLARHIERKNRLALEEMEAIASLGAANCVASGITTVGDASYSGAAATACAEVGLRAIVHLEVFGPGTEQVETRFATNRDRVAGALSDRVRIGISPHTPYTAPLELWREAVALGIPVATHFAESEAEVEWTRSGAGPLDGVRATSIRELAAEGLLSEHVSAAHCVYLDDEELELLARHGVAVVHCPRSNALLGCGIAPLAELRAAGLRVGLGTDSPASTPSFDLFEELRTAVFMTRGRERRAEALTAEEALRLATIDGARVLGMDREIGTLTPGKRADLAVVSLAGSPYDPVEDPIAAVVFGGSPARVLETVVDGKTRYRQGEEDAWPEVRSTASAARQRMLA
jgi:cytosine/adenosine deaminase-related metal-dependent hydrolase